jgi:AcrR family transcriptional regulator
MADRETATDRERLKRAIVELVGERGIRGLTEDELLRHSGVDRAGFERSFKSVGDCYVAVFTEYAEQFLQMALEAIASQSAWRDQVHAVAVAALRFLQEEPNRARLMIAESFYAGERAQVVREQFVAPMAAFVDMGRWEMGDPDSIGPATANAVAGSVLNRIRIEIEAGNSDKLEQLAPKMVFSVLQPYLGTDAAMEYLDVPLR